MFCLTGSRQRLIVDRGLQLISQLSVKFVTDLAKNATLGQDSFFAQTSQLSSPVFFLLLPEQKITFTNTIFYNDKSCRTKIISSEKKGNASATGRKGDKHTVLQGSDRALATGRGLNNS